MQKYKNILFVILVSLLSFLTVVPLFHSGFFPIHDNTQVTRVFEMHQSLSDGMFPVRWVSDLGYGYGYPIFSFYAPLAYYIGALFMALGLSAVVATKMMIGLGLIMAGVTMYFLAREFWGEKGGLVAGVLYTLAPYHGTNVYVRGAIAEMWAYVFIPLAFWGIWKFSKSLYWPYFIFGSIGIAGIVISHNLTAMMIIPFLSFFSFILVFLKRKDGPRAFAPFLIIGAGLLLASFYWIPTLSEIRYTNVSSQTGGGSDYKYHFVCFQQFWTSQIGYGGSSPGCIDGMSLQLGKLHIFAFFASIVGAFFWRKNKYFYPIIAAQVVAVSGIILATTTSTPLWESVPLMKYFQFPWRFETLFLLGSSFLAGFIVVFCKKIFKESEVVSVIFTVVIIMLSVFYYQKFFVPQSFISDASKQTDKTYIRSKVSSISDEYLPKNFDRPPKGSFVRTSFPESKDVVVAEIMDSTQVKRATLVSSKNMQYATNIAYFPALHVFINSKEVKAANDRGRLSFSLPKDKSYVEIKYISTTVEAIGNLLSLAGVLSLALGIISFRHKHKK